MDNLKRYSPVNFAADPIETTTEGQWTVVTEYAEEGPGPWLVDLCHKARWDLQNGRLDRLNPCGVAIPARSGDCRLANGVLVSRMNPGRAAVWHLARGQGPRLPAETAYTDVSEADVFLALLGPDVFRVAEKLSALDFLNPHRRPPCLFQGPWCKVACKIVMVERKAEGNGGILLTCPRGYARDMVSAILAAGAPLGLRPAGEKRFISWLASIRDA